jgi:Fe-S-cluster containining protein
VSSYPIPLRPSDRVAQDQVPEEFVLHASMRPGHMLMGFRDDGSCPFLCGRACSIYRDRPQTCRDYDCRIFAAAGRTPAGERPTIRERVMAWRFTYPAPDDLLEAAAVRRAADFIDANKDRFPVEVRVATPVATAVVAVKTYELFLGQFVQPPEGGVEVAALIAQVAAAALAFDRASQNRKD